MAGDEFVRAFLPVFFVMVGVIYTTKMLAVRARTGARQQHFGPLGATQYWGRVLFEVFRWAIVLACVARAINPALDAWFGPIAFGAATPALAFMGVAFMMGGLALAAYAHNYLGADWRTGVPTEGPAALVTTGPYARLRHPIFVGVHAGQIGLFLAWPSVFTLVCMVVGVTVIQIQARVEEARLKAAFGQRYSDYAARTPGWAPFGSGAVHVRGALTD